MVVESEQAFDAVNYFHESCICRIWTGNRNILYVLVVSESNYWHCSVLQSKACVVCLSRLETRTKESNMYASH